MSDRRVQIIELGVEISQIIMCVCEARIDRQRSLVTADRLLATARQVKAAAEVDVRVGRAGIDRERPRIVCDSVIMSAKMPTGVAQADVNDGGLRRGRERGLVVGEAGLELALAR